MNRKSIIYFHIVIICLIGNFLRAESDCNYVTMLNYVSTSAKYADAYSFSENDSCYMKLELTEIVNFTQGDYRFLDTLPIQSRPIFAFGSIDIACVDETFRPSISLKTYDLEIENSDVLLTAYEDSTNSWLFDAIICSIYMPDSIIAYYSYKESKTIIRKIMDNGETPILETVSDAFYPLFSHDGSEIMMVHYLNGCDSLYKGEIRCYNIEKDSVYLALSSDGYKDKPQRLNLDSPIYYIKESNETDDANIWSYDDKNGELQVTNFKWPMKITDFRLTKEYLYCFLRDQTVKFFKGLPNEGLVRKKIKRDI